ncbi:testis-expressed protein 36 [Stegastes partitus]|uniref:Testis-expressed protein 36 n=1 Tax=Stegastes partitus TaxID=144197 RepID=A0A9Y4K131_9TELE|nr:PREDICTED: testis-expressed sequence 36 protein-like [Stegastes partitus]
MVKGGKRYSSMSNDGKWFAHPVSPENELKTRETCTSTGIMLTQVKSSLPQALNFERYPKWKTQQTSREYPFSAHDNKHALKDDISAFSQGAGLGLRKCLDDRSQHISHFCLCHVRANSSTEDRNLSVYRADFTGKAAVNVPTRARRFPRNHNQKSAEAALAQPGGQFMWFGQVDSDPSETLKVLAASNCEAPSKPQDIPTFKAQKESLREHSRERMQRRSHKEPILNTNFSLPGV